MDKAAKVISNIKKGQKIFNLVKFLKLAAFLWPLPAVVKDGSSYDFIIVGGGTAGCVIAGQLAKLNVSVLLIEAGPEAPVETLLPGLFPYLKGGPIDWNFKSNSEKAYQYHKDSVMEMQQGKVLGGSNQVNYMIYGKGSPKDYDKWAEITEDPSWQFINLCKIFKKIENVKYKKILDSPDIMFHGTKGQINIKKYDSEINEDYFKSYRELGHKTVLDINPNNTVGYTNAYFTIGSVARHSTALSYLSPERKNPNLSVMYNALATEIVFDENKNAIGVKIFTKNNKVITVKVKKEVIISAGVIKSPQLLMISGIGPKAHLEENKIKVISDLPVGQNFTDHPSTILIYKMGKAAAEEVPNPLDFSVAAMDGYIALNQEQNHPDYEILSGVINNPEFFLQACANIFTFKYKICDFIAKAVKGRQVHFVTHSLLRTESRGEIRLKNKNPKVNPSIIPRYYGNKIDLENHAKCVEHYNAVLNTTFFKSVDAELVFPPLKSCDKLEKGTMKYWKCYVQGMQSTLHMYYGTCAMQSVVNSELKVYGVKKLRVADASVIPSSIGSTIQATVIMIAERLVDLLKIEYKLSM